MEGCRVRSRHGTDPIPWEERPYHEGMSHLPGLPVLPSPHVTSERTPGRRESGACQEPEELRGCEKTPVPPSSSWAAWPLPSRHCAELSCCLAKPWGRHG